MNRSFIPNMLSFYRLVLKEVFGLSQQVLLIHFLGSDVWAETAASILSRFKKKIIKSS